MTRSLDNAQTMELVLPSSNLAADLAFFTERLGFLLETIFPADDPRMAVLSGHGLRLRLDRAGPVAPAVLRLACLDPDRVAAGERELQAPNGVRIEIVDAASPLETPRTQHAFVVRRPAEGDLWVSGRGGMLYRDLLPGRLGGAVIASHIRIPTAGPVDDLVHFHDVGFQLIFCVRGWVRVVYEDQGPPFVLKAGDCVTQPPRIRHRVLEASENLQVIEVSAPAEHLTTIDHAMELPTASFKPERTFGGQTFCRSQAEKAVWSEWRRPGFKARETGVGAASAGAASLRVARAVGGDQERWTSHTADVLLGFVWSGAMTIRTEGQGAEALRSGDSFAIPPGMKTALTNCSADLQLLEISLPAVFDTIEHGAVEF